MLVGHIGFLRLEGLIPSVADRGAAYLAGTGRSEGRRGGSLFGYLLPDSIYLSLYRTLRLNKTRPRTLEPSRIKLGGIGTAVTSTPNKPAPTVPPPVPKILAKYVSPGIAAKVKLPGPTMLSTVSVAVVIERKRKSNPKNGSSLKSERVALYVNGAVSA